MWKMSKFALALAVAASASLPARAAKSPTTKTAMWATICEGTNRGQSLRILVTFTPDPPTLAIGPIEKGRSMRTMPATVRKREIGFTVFGYHAAEDYSLVVDFNRDKTIAHMDGGDLECPPASTVGPEFFR
jgi:hypothetical protein